jgi:broad specificity phosphatase PhoE
MNIAIYFLRQGETALSKADSFCGSLHTGLTESGLEMAKEYADTGRERP